MSRVKLYSGKTPIIIVAPHGGGPTDIRSAEMSEVISYDTSSYAVINTGWIRSKKVNCEKGLANCNSLRHCKKKIVHNEFIRPIDKYKNRILETFKRAYIFLIHGMDDTIRNYQGVDVIVGYGHGDPPRHTCPLSFKDRFITCLAMEGFTPAQGKSGGRLSAWDSDNLSQLYSKNSKISTIQVEVALSLRETDEIALHTSRRIASAINRTFNPGLINIISNIPEM